MNGGILVLGRTGTLGAVRRDGVATVHCKLACQRNAFWGNLTMFRSTAVVTMVLLSAAAGKRAALAYPVREGKEPVSLPRQPHLEKLANRNDRVCCWWDEDPLSWREGNAIHTTIAPVAAVDPTGHFCYAGDTRALNEFLTECAALKEEPVSIYRPLCLIIHPGPAPTEQGHAYDWKMTWAMKPHKEKPDANGLRHFHGISQLEVWLGGSINRDRIRMPAGIEVASSNEEIVSLPSQPRLEKLANRNDRVYYRWNQDPLTRRVGNISVITTALVAAVHPTGHFCYAGDTKGVNQFLTECAALKEEPVSICRPLCLIIHPGRAPTEQGHAYAWKMTWAMKLQKKNPESEVKRHFHGISRLEVWLGGDVSLDQLKVPTSIVVQSGGEIEEFVEQHERARSGQTGIPIKLETDAHLAPAQ